MSTTTPTTAHTTGVTETAMDEPIGRSLFPAVVRSEWTKMRSVRSTVWSLFATFGITVGLGAALCFAYISRYDELSRGERLDFDPHSLSVRGVNLAQVAIGVLGVLVITSEYTTGLIRTTFAAVPQRRVVLAAKTAVFGVVAFVVATISVFVAFFAGQAVLADKNLDVSLSDPHVLRAVLGAGAYLTFVGLLGLAIGAIVRRTAGGIATLFAVVLVLPLLAQALPSPWSEDVDKFLPTGLGHALFSARAEPNLLSPGNALIAVIGWLVITYAIATFLITRRDT